MLVSVITPVCALGHSSKADRQQRGALSPPSQFSVSSFRMGSLEGRIPLSRAGVCNHLRQECQNSLVAHCVSQQKNLVIMVALFAPLVERFFGIFMGSRAFLLPDSTSPCVARSEQICMACSIRSDQPLLECGAGAACEYLRLGFLEARLEKVQRHSPLQSFMGQGETFHSRNEARESCGLTV